MMSDACKTNCVCCTGGQLTSQDFLNDVNADLTMLPCDRHCSFSFPSPSPEVGINTVTDKVGAVGLSGVVEAAAMNTVQQQQQRLSMGAMLIEHFILLLRCVREYLPPALHRT